jgi:SAM-dependent methyltransferase
MIDHPLYGRVAPELGWVPAPSYLLRRARVLARLSQIEPGRLLEVGCGAGALLADLASRGFRCQALESGARAVEIARALTADLPDVTIDTAPPVDPANDTPWRGAFDQVLALEVLEHIEDDTGALAQWAGWLQDGGDLLLSVPAHPERWNASDVWAGHFRRYRRRELEEKLSAAGLEVVAIESWGVPLANLIHPVRARAHARALAGSAASAAAAAAGDRPQDDPDARREGTARSGVERSREMGLYPLQASWPGRLAMAAACRLQNLFLDTDLGNGYLAHARRRGDHR